MTDCCRKTAYPCGLFGDDFTGTVCYIWAPLLRVGIEIEIGRCGFFKSDWIEIFLQITYPVSFRSPLTMKLLSTAEYVYPARQPSFASKTLPKEPVTATAFTLGLPRAD